MNLKTMSKIIKAKQASDTTSAMNFIRAKQAADTTKMYDRDEMIETINKITRGEIKPANKTVKPVYKTTQGKKTYKVKDNNGEEIEMTKEEFEGFVKRRGVKVN